MAKSTVGLLLVMILAMLGTGVAQMEVRIWNRMYEILNVECESKDEGTLTPMGSPNIVLHGFNYSFTIPTQDLAHGSYSCRFAALGKPTTTLVVYEGHGSGARNTPCACVGPTCLWSVMDYLDVGFLCNSSSVHYSHAWGKCYVRGDEVFCPPQ